MQRAREARETASSASESARVALTEAVESLKKVANLSLRDAADMLGVSHQRVHQLMGK